MSLGLVEGHALGVAVASNCTVEHSCEHGPTPAPCKQRTMAVRLVMSTSRFGTPKNRSAYDDFWMGLSSEGSQADSLRACGDASVDGRADRMKGMHILDQKPARTVSHGGDGSSLCLATARAAASIWAWCAPSSMPPAGARVVVDGRARLRLIQLRIVSVRRGWRLGCGG